MDGIGTKKTVFIIGATNRPDNLNGAIMRPGRLYQLVYIPIQEADSRLAILKAALRKVPVHDFIDLKHITDPAEGYSGVDLTRIRLKAIKEAVRDDFDPEPMATSKHLEDLEDSNAVRLNEADTLSHTASDEQQPRMRRYMASFGENHWMKNDSGNSCSLLCYSELDEENQSNFDEREDIVDLEVDLEKDQVEDEEEEEEEEDEEEDDVNDSDKQKRVNGHVVYIGISLVYKLLIYFSAFLNFSDFYDLLL
ncbi:MAG: putative AAA ATPase [Streblomastix strix]|uniref:Putative AAA ATPase n=1 Tax=Streblomastix strix TaxID=222440 RepID=A0A5J4UWU0_9EUKA|nr:MAG: putative AAA ATPase [Streblomastix strix]